MIRCVNVHKSYTLGQEKVLALRGIDLDIKQSGFYGIMGASGSGKSTLLHLLAALDTPDQGTVNVANTELAELSERDLTLFRRKKIGIIFQQFNLISTMTAKENVQLPGMLAGEDQAFLESRSTELLATLGLEHRMTHRPDSLSGGEQQRVAIARALLFSPKVILADEPTGNLDSAASKRLWALLKEIAAKQATTIVMVTHEPVAASYCQRVYVLQDGLIHGTIETESEGLDASGVASRYQQLVATA